MRRVPVVEATMAIWPLWKALPIAQSPDSAGICRRWRSGLRLDRDHDHPAGVVSKRCQILAVHLFKPQAGQLHE